MAISKRTKTQARSRKRGGKTLGEYVYSRLKSRQKARLKDARLAVSQAQRELQRARKALAKLEKSGIIRKVDKRRKATKYQRSLFRKFADLIGGKASALRPKNAASYKGLFKVRGKVVIVPRRKGERLSIDKRTGEIVGTRKTVGGRVVRSRLKLLKAGEKIPRPKGPVQYAIPFARGDRVEWFRFPDFDKLQEFMQGYEPPTQAPARPYKNWRRYVLTETINSAQDDEADEKLSERLERKLGRKPKFKYRKARK